MSQVQSVFWVLNLHGRMYNLLKFNHNLMIIVGVNRGQHTRIFIYIDLLNIITSYCIYFTISPYKSLLNSVQSVKINITHRFLICFNSLNINYILVIEAHN